MSNILIFFIVGGVLLLGAIILNVMLIIHGFKRSVKDGVIALLAPGVLAGALTCIYLASHMMAMENVGAEEVQQQGEKEVNKQIEELNNIEDIQLDL